MAGLDLSDRDAAGAHILVVHVGDVGDTLPREQVQRESQSLACPDRPPLLEGADFLLGPGVELTRPKLLHLQGRDNRIS